MVPLKGENRILARAGLEKLQSTGRLGLSALFEVSGMRLGEPVKPYDISFRLGPRINASGRLADASLPIQMLLSSDEKFCRQAATQLNDYNRERQEIEKLIYEAALKQIETLKLHSNPFGYVLYDPSWHAGVVGVVASRLTHELNRPCIVMGGENGLAKGSGRSVEGISLVEILNSAKELLKSWGGHPMAVGVSLDPQNFLAFQERFDAAIRAKLGDKEPERTLNITAFLKPSEITPAFMGELDLLYPYGIENPVPTFAIVGVKLSVAPEVFSENHDRFQIHLSGVGNEGKTLWGVAWNKADRLPPVNEKIDIAFELGWNNWKGRKYLQATLIDWR